MSDLSVEVVGNGKRLLNGVSLSIRRGKSLGICGPSGSGKSTLARAIAGVLSREVRVVAGEMLFGGAGLAYTSEDRPQGLRRGAISILFQEPRLSFNPLYRVGEQIATFVTMGCSESPDEASIRERSATVLRELGFADPERILNSRPPELSSGQLQRCALVAPVICNPRLLVADEPTSSLDAFSRRRVVAMLQRLAREGGTSLLVVSHDVTTLREIADCVVTMDDGSLRPLGDTAPSVPAPRSQGTCLDSSERPVRIQVRGLRKRFQSISAGREIVVLDRLDFDLQAGEVLGIRGPSGAGKTTLAKCLMNLVPPDDGTIEISGTRLRRNDSPQTVARLGMVLIWQDPFASLNPRRTIRQQLRDTILSRAKAKSVADEEMQAAEQSRFPAALLDRQPAQLSGGQAQRAAIARALSARPTVMIADEPFAYLDASARRVVAAGLREWCERCGCSLLLISHDADTLADICGRIIELREGRFVAPEIEENA